MKLYLFTIFSLFTIAVSAQDLGKVTIAELQATKSIIDTSAVAEVIFSKGNTTFFVNGLFLLIFSPLIDNYYFLYPITRV